ncbi:hypothetical protein LB465_00070 [Salegentibacter sp. LM13S]|uniref:hypothetical protein n=1 Tax=Salegentibacter lacus TaxID=2873599 RepID=UPI001CCD2408|nr:hypothetical protein [Salegentibacter lacus]MBZ9629154.1 hypothetical protein [Salegentibacter lacus]
MKTIKILNILWLSIIAIGVILLIFKIVVDSEPGAIPLFLVTLGISGFLISKFRKKSGTKTTK